MRFTAQRWGEAMRLISFALTPAQLLDGTKTVTRRLGWATLRPGARLQAVEKAMGLRRGESPKRLCEIEVVSVRREPLDAIDYADCVREGFPQLSPSEFVAFFCRHMGCEPAAMVTRIEFRRVADPRT
jgi:hypothetical protein